MTGINILIVEDEQKIADSLKQGLTENGFFVQVAYDGVMGYLATFDFEGNYITWTTDGANAGTVFARSGKFNCTNVCGTIKVRNGDHRFIASALGRVSKY